MLMGTAAGSKERFVFDATGWWWFSLNGDALLTWDSLAGTVPGASWDPSDTGAPA
jgi:hypothetical protein